ncbi:hypothetical protein [Proteiniphilum sp. UBA7639]|uniref:hypothetical protein n=1 Tax=Proteiniphilum sp. UBA7639 TaxID=1947289 RepID=UPI00257A912E|nr:hypothetical protein [Proteiniphilum sp. UBA7639]
MKNLFFLIGFLFGMSLTCHFFMHRELVAIRYRYASTLPKVQLSCFAGRMAIIITVLNIVLLVTLIALYKQKSLETGATPIKQLD